MQLLSISIYKKKDLSINFVIRLPKSKNWCKVKYDLILAKMVYQEMVFTMLIIEQLAKVPIKTIFKYYSLPNSIITN